MQEEVYWQCDIGALQKLSTEEAEKRDWCFPVMGIPNKDGTIRLVFNFQKLNSQLNCRAFPLPTINQMINEIINFEFISTLDLNMGYLSMPLKEETKEIINIIFEFGMFECCVLTMGVKPAGDLFQERMVSLLTQLRICAETLHQ